MAIPPVGAVMGLGTPHHIPAGGTALIQNSRHLGLFNGVDVGQAVDHAQQALDGSRLLTTT